MQIKPASGARHPWGSAPSPFEEMGGESGVRALAHAFYDAVEADAPVLRAMLPADTSISRQKLYEFLSGWSGGPQLYWERRGHPALGMRHSRFPIDAEAAGQWMGCLRTAMTERSFPGPLAGWLEAELGRTAHMLVNRAD